MIPHGLNPKKNRAIVNNRLKRLNDLHKKGQLPNVLIYDIETTPLSSWHFGLGKQVVRHNQLRAPYHYHRIMCVSWAWLHEDTVHSLEFDIKNHDSTALVKEFQKVLEKADVVLGKNNARFDDKHVKMAEVIAGLTPSPAWKLISDDLETQIRKHFWLASYSLDHVAKMLLGAGKDKMDFSDWFDIMEYKDQKKLDKMVKYNMKDVMETQDLVILLWPHLTFKTNASTFNRDIRCPHVHCQSSRICKNGTRMSKNGGLRQGFICKDCGGSFYVKATNPKTLGNI